MENELDYLLYGLDTSKHLLYSKWAKPIGSAQYRKGLSHLLQVILDHDLKLWIHESALLDNLCAEDKKWTTEEFALILSQTKLKYAAIVRPQDSTSPAFSIALRDKAYRIYGKQVTIEFFDSIDEAKAWILPRLQHYRLPSLSTPINFN